MIVYFREWLNFIGYKSDQLWWISALKRTNHFRIEKGLRRPQLLIMYRPILALVLLAGVVLGQYPINVVELCRAIPGRMGSHFVRDPRNCSNIYNCDADLSFPVLITCGYNLHFSQSQQVCVYKNSDYDDCKEHVSPGKYSKWFTLLFFFFFCISDFFSKLIMLKRWSFHRFCIYFWC